MSEPFVVHEEMAEHLRIRIVIDPFADNPREMWDHLGTMVCWHSRHSLGDEQRRDDWRDWERELAMSLDPATEDRIWYWENGNGWAQIANVQDALAACEKQTRAIVDGVLDQQLAAMLPLYLYDHSGLTMNTTGFHCPWDSGQVGWIYATREATLECFQKQRLTDSLRKQAREALQHEVVEYDQYLCGEVYGFLVSQDVTCKECGNVETEIVDSCYGYYGDRAYALEEARSAARCTLRGA